MGKADSWEQGVLNELYKPVVALAVVQQIFAIVPSDVVQQT